ncbi:SDR family oxidoreductase [Micromonospora sp. NBRC 101691]|uniref:SDR family oxidoreductase n=1 Tax=Micromonospora sp. NBRC 101691 TaxID=3032198 RepID=UPI00249FF432|nr:SDR family oxidoreductase [Micromonospora sp. NBRC 101691]GLY23398.1 short-chain dehydrogenase [Micromonospora sp. NBRC 101691]
MTTMSGKVCLVTGGTSGIGRETAARLAELGATVVIVGRDAERGRAAVEEIRHRAPSAEVDLLTADMSSLAEVRRLAAEVLEKYHRLDVLDNNAGVIMLKRQFTVDGYETMFAVNHLAPFLLTNLLRERLVGSAPARVITVSSNVHSSVKQIPWGELARGEPSYPLSKLANILFTVELAKRLTGTGVVANCLHPGLIRTQLGREVRGVAKLLVTAAKPFMGTVQTGAATPVHLASAPAAAGVTGGYFCRGRQIEPSPLARDPEAAARLWALSEELVA